MTLTIEQRQTVADAVGISWEAFQVRHPSQAAAIQQRLGTPIADLVCEALASDAEFIALVADTDAEVSTAEVAKIVLPVAMSIALKLIAGI